MASDLVNGDLIITAEPNGSKVTVENYSRSDKNGILIGWGIKVTDNGMTTSYTDLFASGNIVFRGGAGNDFFQNNTTRRATVFGGAGDDELIGGDRSTIGDAIWGGLGNDRILGRGGNDHLNGEEGNDFIFGGAGDDYMLGGTGNDQMVRMKP